MDCPKSGDTEAVAVPVLPDDLLVDILSRIPVKSVCRFKCVSKAWRDLIADPFHRKKLPQTLEGFFFTAVEPRDSDGGGDDCGGDCGDGEHLGGTDDSDDEFFAFMAALQRSEEKPPPPRQFCGFIDVLQRFVRPVDFSYLSELPGPGILEETRLLHCCNGLLLFGVRHSGCDVSESYIVCNPATKQCVAVPSSGLTWHQMISESTVTSLLFDPGFGLQFNLVQVLYNTSVHVYSSETQAWSHNKIDWVSDRIAPYFPGVYVNGMLHLLSYFGKDQLSVVDVEGNIQKIIPAPCQVGRGISPLSSYIGQSQGCLYYICRELQPIWDGLFRRHPKLVLGRLFIWVLQDYDRQHWVLKDSVSFSELFGEKNGHMDSTYDVDGIHPDRSLVFLIRHWDRKLISYNMDSKEVCDLCTLGHGYKRIAPYVPYFSEFGACKNKQ